MGASDTPLFGYCIANLGPDGGEWVTHGYRAQREGRGKGSEVFPRLCSSVTCDASGHGHARASDRKTRGVTPCGGIAPPGSTFRNP